LQTLSPQILRRAYTNGYFPMPDESGENIYWYRPDPRAIIPLDGFHCSRSLRRSIHRYTCTLDQDFLAVITGCSERPSTWITAEMKEAYVHLHQKGHAHSVEVWDKDELVGGLYGVHYGSAFFAESKFSKKKDASKVALYHLVEHLKKQGFSLLEVQFLTDHLKSLGAIAISDHEYTQKLHIAMQTHRPFQSI
jgi:leucyl/phenylalanyl-tRNA---protein transferase